MRVIKGLITAAIAIALFAVPAAALAKRGDRNHDRIPDKWERKHHLSTHVNVARKDPDHDGLSNLAEFKDKTDPQRADTDGDGVDDGQEVADDTNPRKDDSDGDGVDDDQEIAGTIVSFDNGLLTIQLPADGAGTVSGTVNDQTKIECDDQGENNDDQGGDDRPTTTATASDDGEHSAPGDGSGTGDDSASDDNSGPASADGSDDASHEAGDDNDADNTQPTCTSADLKQGARVHEAELTQAPDGSNVFTKIELVPAA